MTATTNTHGRRARNPYMPSMRRIEQHAIRQRREGQRKLSAYEALQQLVSRIVRSDIADADRLKYSAVALVEAKAHAADAVQLFSQLARSFAQQVEHYQPIMRSLAVPPKETDEPPSMADAVHRKLCDTAMRKLPANLIAFLLDTPNNACPCCGRKENP